MAQPKTRRLVTEAALETALAGSGLIAEAVRDVIAAALRGGDGLTVTVDDAGDTITLAPAIKSAEQVQDIAAAMLTGAAHSGLTWAYDDDAGQLVATVTAPTSSGAGATDPEVVRDTLAAALRGTGITITADDDGDTITLAAAVRSVAGRTGAITLAKADVGLGSVDNTADTAKPVSTAQATAIGARVLQSAYDTDKAGLPEQVQDIVGAMVKAGSNAVATYDDAAGTLTLSATTTGGSTTTADGETVRDTIAAALVAGAGVQVLVDDDADTITVQVSGLTATQVPDLPTSKITGLDTALSRKVEVIRWAGTAAFARPVTASPVWVIHPAGTTVPYGGTATGGTGLVAGSGDADFIEGDAAITAADISDATTLGRSLLKAADATTARDALGAVSSTTYGTDKTTLQTLVDTKGARALTKRTITAAYTVTTADTVDKVLHTTTTAATTITLPSGIDQETAIPWRQYGTGLITFAAASGMTLVSRGGATKSAGQYAGGTITLLNATTWLLEGDITS